MLYPPDTCHIHCTNSINRVNDWLFAAQAPEKKLVVKELVKQAVVSAKGKGEIGGELDRKSLKRALRQRLKKCGTVDIRGGVAYYTKSST